MNHIWTAEMKSWIFFRLLYTITYDCIHNCEDQSSLDFISTVHIWFISYTSLTFWHHFHRNIWTHKYYWPAPNISGFIAQLVRALHWYQEFTGSNPVEVLNFFSGLFKQLHMIVFTARISQSSLEEKVIWIANSKTLFPLIGGFVTLTWIITIMVQRALW